MRAAILAAVLTLAACADYEGIARSWLGHPLDDLTWAWGPPNAERRLDDGRAVVVYAWADRGSSYIVNDDDDDAFTQVINTEHRCRVTFRTNTREIITSFQYSGNMAGCNKLYRGKPRASAVY